MKAGRALVIVSDDWVARLLATQLRAYGFEVNSCNAGSDAVLVASVVQPDCVIIEKSLPDRDGIAVVQALRLRVDAFGQAPIILLSDAEDIKARIEAFEAGVDCFMLVPCRTEEVVLQACSLVSMARRCSGLNQRVGPASATDLPVDSTRPGGNAFEGNLSQMSVATILTLLEMERRSGHFKVDDGTNYCSLDLVSGSVVSATMNGESREVITVVREILRWKEGRFRFRHGVEGTVPPGRATIGALLIEAVRLEDESLRDQPAEEPSATRASQTSAMGRLSLWSDVPLEPISTIPPSPPMAARAPAPPPPQPAARTLAPLGTMKAIRAQSQRPKMVSQHANDMSTPPWVRKTPSIEPTPKTPGVLPIAASSADASVGARVAKINAAVTIKPPPVASAPKHRGASIDTPARPGPWVPPTPGPALLPTPVVARAESVPAVHAPANPRPVTEREAVIPGPHPLHDVFPSAAAADPPTVVANSPSRIAQVAQPPARTTQTLASAHEIHPKPPPGVRVSSRRQRKNSTTSPKE